MMARSLLYQLAAPSALLFAFSLPLSGQVRVCNIVTPTTNLVRVTRADGAAITYLSQPRVQCNDGTFIQADSSESFEATSFHRFFGNVVFLDEDRRLSSENAQYFSETGTLRAQGQVEVIDPDGSIITGERLTLLQAGENREEDDLLMTTGRPRAVLYPAVSEDSTTAERPQPYDITAGRIRFIGRRIFQARTRVEITRETMRAFSDSAAFDQDIGTMTLYGDARVLDQGDDSVDIRGDTITMEAPGNVLKSIVARREGRVITSEVDLKGSEVRIYFSAEKEVDRVVAVKIAEEGSRPAFLPPDSTVAEADSVAAAADTLGVDPNEFTGDSTVTESDIQPQPSGMAEDFFIQGDSIEVQSPAGVLKFVYAVGRAYGESTSRDSLNVAATPEEVQKDWIRGDTLIITFLPPDTLSPNPSVAGSTDGAVTEGAEDQQSQIESMWAIGSASTLYRTMPRDTVGIRPGKLNVNYLLGDMIKLFMEDGAVNRMEADNARGLFLQPTPPSRPDSTERPDTTATPNNTSRGGPLPAGGHRYE